VDFSDEALAKYQKALKRFEKKIKESEGNITDYETATDESIDEFWKQQKEVTKDIIETYLGEGTFEDLYEKAGRVSKNLMNLVHYLNGMYLEEVQKKDEEMLNKYLSNVKK
ncbi:hypothetical protein, partial [Streptococcus sobrinus]|uniref:hypothetical protein n=1 Tax=Streptococcus sobrinus TaxID=1310 RepID=UPI0003660382